MTTESTLAPFDEEAGGECPPELYRAEQAACGLAGFAAVNDDQIALFQHQGYLVIHDAFTPAEVGAALAGLLDLIGGKYPAYRGVQYEKNTRELVGTLMDGMPYASFGRWSSTSSAWRCWRCIHS